MENRTQNFFPAFRPLDYGAALKIERKMSHLNIALDQYASIVTVIHYILVISVPVPQPFLCYICAVLWVWVVTIFVERRTHTHEHYSSIDPVAVYCWIALCKIIYII